MPIGYAAFDDASGSHPEIIAEYSVIRGSNEPGRYVNSPCFESRACFIEFHVKNDERREK